MAKKKIYRHIYKHEIQLVFASILHNRKGEPIKEEFIRMQRILQVAKMLKKEERQIVYKNYLRLFSIPYENVSYYTVPKNVTFEEFEHAVDNYLSTNKSSKKNNEVWINDKREEKQINIKEDNNPFLNHKKNKKSMEKLEYRRNVEPNLPTLDPIQLKKEEKLIDVPNKRQKFNSTKIPHHTKENLSPSKKTMKITLTERNQSIVQQLKQLYKNTCQICRQRVDLGGNRFYSEVHHIQPLGKHDGPDIKENMIVLCPNHHIMFDNGAITLDTDEKGEKILQHYNEKYRLNRKPIYIKHKIDGVYIEYHNMNIFKKNVKQSQSDIIVDYGDSVVFFDGAETIEVTLENYHNRFLMNNMQRMLIYKRKGEKFLFNGYYYKIISIRKKENNDTHK